MICQHIVDAIVHGLFEGRPSAYLFMILRRGYFSIPVSRPTAVSAGCQRSGRPSPACRSSGRCRAAVSWTHIVDGCIPQSFGAFRGQVVAGVGVNLQNRLTQFIQLIRVEVNPLAAQPGLIAFVKLGLAGFQVFSLKDGNQFDAEASLFLSEYSGNVRTGMARTFDAINIAVDITYDSDIAGGRFEFGQNINVSWWQASQSAVPSLHSK